MGTTTIRAYSPVTGATIATATIKTGRSNHARRVPSAFVKACLAAPSYRITADVKRGDRGRTLVQVRGVWYTRVVNDSSTYRSGE